MHTYRPSLHLPLVLFIAVVLAIPHAQSQCVNPSFTFGLIADCQCGSSTCSSQDRLMESVTHFNQTNIEFIGHLGDLIQTNFSNFNVVLPIISQSTAPVNFALGNHDYDIPNAEKPNLPTLLGMPDFYYDEVIENWRFIYIETTETGEYAQAAHPNVTVCGTAGLSTTQLDWIDSRILLAEQNDENVILFGHHPHADMCNGNDFRTLIESSPNVVAYMSGHRHGGRYELFNNVHYLTIKSMLGRATSTFAELELRNDAVYVWGFGEQEDFVLPYTVVGNFDADGDGVCDGDDLCPGFDDNLIGTACNDGDPCTTGETYDNNCSCSGGSLVDSDGDGICNLNDQCPGFDDNLIGAQCNDGNPCTVGETYDNNCSCSGGTLLDNDGDGVCNADDQCPGLDDTLIGTQCNDGNPCTVGETYDNNCACTGGTLMDNDGDGVCNNVDVCPGFDDNLIGTQCNDGDPCTTGETYDNNCNCSGGTFLDDDGDGVCNITDQCPGLNDGLIGMACSDGDPCTTGEIFDSSCACVGGTTLDDDGDGICNTLDQCPGFDDTIDNNQNGLPDGCESIPQSPCGFISFLNGTEGFFHHQVSSRIFSQQTIDGSEVIYTAGDNINLLNDFEVKLGTVFEAFIEDCSN